MVSLPLSRRLLRNLAGSWGAMAIRLPITLLLTPFLIAQLGEERYGAFGVLLSLLAYMNLAGGPLHSSIGRELAHAGANRAHRARVLASAVSAAAILAALTAAIGPAIAGPLASAMRLPAFIRPDALVCFAAMIATVVLSQLLTPFLGLLISRNRYDLVDLIEALSQVLYAVLLVLIFQLSGPSLARLGFAHLAAQATAGIVYAVLALRADPHTRLHFSAVDRKEVRSLLSFSGQLFLINLSVLITYQTDNLVIARMIGIGAVAHYAVAASLILRIRQLMYGLSRSFMPATADPAATPERLRELHFRGTRYATLLVCGLGAVSAGLAVPFFTLWLGEGFRSSALVFRILIAASVFAMSQYVTNAVLTGLRRTRKLMLSEVIGAVANLGLSIALVHAGLGLAGVAIGTLVPMVVRNVWLAVHGARAVRAPFLPYVMRIYLPAAAALLFTALPLAAIARSGEHWSWMGLVTAGLGGAILFATLAYGLVLDHEDRGRVRALSKRLAIP
jgi:O-antigen/teichoic acid export membrane protein